MKTLYLDIFSGISGDMFIGAMLDLGVDFHQLQHELEKLGLGGYHLHAARQQRSNIEGIKFDVHLENHHHHEHTQAGATTDSHESHQPEHSHSHHHKHEANDEHEHSHSHEDESKHGRHFAEIKKLISESTLSEWIKQKAISVFYRVAVAEGKIHGHPPNDVHFHEVGAVDSIIDIVGACLCLEMLGQPRVLAANVVEGTGWVDCAHGRFPVPTTATLEILGARGIALTQCAEPHELVTPTGAALLAEFAETFGPMQNLVATKIGYGLGTRENKTRPNILRAVLGEISDSKIQIQNQNSKGSRNDWDPDTIAVLQTNLDDCNSEILGHFVEKSLAAGALDVFYTPIQMKKNRPGILLTVLCAESDVDKFSEIILRETSAFGIRRSIAERRKLQREFQTVQTSHGSVTIKIGRLNGKIVQATPEFESAKKLAEAKNIPLQQIYQATMQVIGSGLL